MKISFARGWSLGRWPSVAGAILLLAVPLVLQAQSGADDTATRQKQLQALKAEIEANRQEIDKLKSRERNLSRLQDRIRKDRELTRRYLRELQAEDAAIRTDLATQQADLFDKESALSESADRLRQGLVRYYKMRQIAGPELIFSSRTFGELFARSQFLARVVYRERLDLEALATERRELATSAAVLEKSRRGVETLQEEKRREEERLRRQGAAALAELQEVRDERGDLERRAKELEESQAAIRRMIERMERDRARGRGHAAPGAFAGSLAARKGRLLWPVEGSVVADFGFEVNPKYGTKVPQNGIDVAASAGTPIHSVAPGVVVYTDWLPGYGRTVILDHGSGYYTLYAHASALTVSRGQTVAEGEVIARVGDTDSIRGSCLHFEVREGERALNPRDWLR